jgi:uncharacterized membrane protein
MLWSLAIGWLGIFAMINGGFLTMEHARYLLDGTGTGICSALSSTGCSVTAGRFGSIAGIPVAIFGFAASFLMVMLSMIAFVRRRLEHDAVRAMIFALATAFVGASLVMAGLSLVEGRFCPFCVAWYGLNLLMWLSAWALRDRSFVEAMKTGWASLGRPIGWISLGVVGLAMLTSTVAYKYALGDLQGAQDAQVEAVCAQMESAPDVSAESLQALLAGAPRKVVGQDREGPVVQLVELSDLACQHCASLWKNVGEYAASAPHPVEIVLAHFPLDSKCNPKVSSEFHPDACRAARAVECAARQGRFGAMVDALFASASLRRSAINGLAMAVVRDTEAFGSCMDEKAWPASIQQGIALAEAVGLEGTPTLLVGGHRITGSLSPKTISRVLNCGEKSR